MRPDLRPKIEAAGVVLLKREGDRTFACLIHRPVHKDWSLPKGKLARGEHIITAALREAQEETGQRVKLGLPLPSQEYRVAGEDKIVYYWASTVAEEGIFKPGAEVDQMEWMPLEEAQKRLTHRRDKQTVKKAADFPETSPLVIVRHARAMRRALWDRKSSDLDRPLTSAGRIQAIALTDILHAFGVTKVFTSPANRCLNTVAPFAQDYGLKIRLEPALGEGEFRSDPKSALKRVKKISSKPGSTVMCTHRPLLPEVIESIAKKYDIQGNRKALFKPLRPGSFIVLHRQIKDGKATKVIAVERHDV